MACWHGQIDILNRLLELPESRLDVNIQDDRGKTGFHVACWHGHINIVNRLLELPDARLDVNIRDDRGETAIFTLCYYGHLDIINRLLELSEERMNLIIHDYSLGRNIKSVFHLACYLGNLAIVNRLLELPDERLDINMKDHLRRTGFDVACEHGRLPVVKRLLEVARTRHIDVDYGLRLAYHFGHADVVAAIRQYFTWKLCSCCIPYPLFPARLFSPITFLVTAAYSVRDFCIVCADMYNREWTGYE